MMMTIIIIKSTISVLFGTRSRAENTVANNKRKCEPPAIDHQAEYHIGKIKKEKRRQTCLYC